MMATTVIAVKKRKDIKATIESASTYSPRFNQSLTGASGGKI